MIEVDLLYLFSRHQNFLQIQISLQIQILLNLLFCLLSYNNNNNPESDSLTFIFPLFLQGTFLSHIFFFWIKFDFFNYLINKY